MKNIGYWILVIGLVVLAYLAAKVIVDTDPTLKAMKESFQEQRLNASLSIKVTDEEDADRPDGDYRIKTVDSSISVYMIDGHKFLQGGSLLHHPNCDCFKLPLLFPDDE